MAKMNIDSFIIIPSLKDKETDDIYLTILKDRVKVKDTSFNIPMSDLADFLMYKLPENQE